MSLKRHVEEQEKDEEEEEEVQVVLVHEDEYEDEEGEQDEEWIVVNVVVPSGEPTKRRGISDRELLDTALTFCTWKRW